MRRTIVVVVTLILLSAAVIVAVRLRVAGALVLRGDTAVAGAQKVAPPIWPSIESETTAPPRPPSPPKAFDGSTTAGAPPEGWVWWGGMAFRKDARIQSNYEDGGLYGYRVPVQYTNDGTLVVASKYPDHSACIWSYDTTSGKFAVLHQKTRQAVYSLTNSDDVRALCWREMAREYTWDRGNPPQRRSRGRQVTLRGGAREDQCYSTDLNPLKIEGGFFESRTQEGWSSPLNQGSIVLGTNYSDFGVSIPFLRTSIRLSEAHTLTVQDALTKTVLDSMRVENGIAVMNNWDFGKGLVMLLCADPFRGPKEPRKPARLVLLTYPQLRIVARADFPAYELQSMSSLKDGLALDVVMNDAYSANVDRGPISPRSLAPENPRVYRIRVPDNWRSARGQKNTACIWEEPPRGLATLEVTEQDRFDAAKFDAQQDSWVKDDPVPKNIYASYVYRDGVMYWRKRHTGEVVMAALADLDTQTVIGGAGAVWDGFRLNPARDELVTWRENGEIVFWRAAFPAAETLYKARVITDEKPHRLEAI